LKFPVKSGIFVKIRREILHFPVKSQDHDPGRKRGPAIAIHVTVHGW